MYIASLSWDSFYLNIVPNHDSKSIIFLCYIEVILLFNLYFINDHLTMALRI